MNGKSKKPIKKELKEHFIMLRVVFVIIGFLLGMIAIGFYLDLQIKKEKQEEEIVEILRGICDDVHEHNDNKIICDLDDKVFFPVVVDKTEEGIQKARDFRKLINYINYKAEK